MVMTLKRTGGQGQPVLKHCWKRGKAKSG